MECEVCGNESEDAFEVVRHVGKHTFDTFECAIYAMAPLCANCDVRVIGHPVKEDDHTFCCAHCAEAGPSERAASGEEEEEDEEEEDVANEESGEEEEGQEEEESQEEGGGEKEGEGEEEGSDELEQLDERISQARQSAQDLLSSPEDEAESGEAQGGGESGGAESEDSEGEEQEG